MNDTVGGYEYRLTASGWALGLAAFFIAIRMKPIAFWIIGRSTRVERVS